MPVIPPPMFTDGPLEQRSGTEVRQSTVIHTLSTHLLSFYYQPGTPWKMKAGW